MQLFSCTNGKFSLVNSLLSLLREHHMFIRFVLMSVCACAFCTGVATF